MSYEELVESKKNIGDMTKEELFTYCGGLLSEVWDYEKENIDLQNRLNSLMEAHKNSGEEIERLNNIIKEVREYLTDEGVCILNKGKQENERLVWTWENYYDLLEILKGSDIE